MSEDRSAVGWDDQPTDEIDLGMSNADGNIDEGFAEALRQARVFGHHAGWDFCGRVWWDGSRFVEDVYRYRRLVATHRANTLPELMALVNDSWGWE